MIRFGYRPDIDGLRAVAVLLVLLFHAELGFTGGFVGVDVFFVISGFLITGLILKQQRAETFSLPAFWGRRTARIIPAVSVMVFVTLVAGCLILLPRDLDQLASSAVWQQLMLSNVFFYQNTGYFGGPAEMMPLLHTWSLAVEEQFYLAFPFLLVFCRRLTKRTTLGILLGLAFVSLAVGQWSVHHWPSGGFFLIPARMWELLLGAMLAFCPEPTRWRKSWLEVFAWSGFACILATSWTFSSTTKFPGVAALVPCVGAALIIYANSAQQTSLGRLLSYKRLVFVGLISYSLYLWHWPILAFLHYRHGHDLTVVVRIGALLLSVACAYISWKFVETPFRHGFANVRLRKTASAAVAAASVLIGFALWMDHTGGLPSRYPEHVQRFLSSKRMSVKHYTGLERVRQGDLTTLGVAREVDEPIEFLVWSDSHGMVLREMFDSLSKEQGLSGVMAAQMGTPPVLGVWKPNQCPFAEMPVWNASVMQYIRDNRVANVILVSRWAIYVEGGIHGKSHMLISDEHSERTDLENAKAALRTGLAQTLDELEELGVRVWIVKQVPCQLHSPKREVAQAALLGQQIPSGVSIATHRERQHNVNSIIDSVAKGRAGVRVCDPTEYCFDELGYSRIASRTGIFYRDGNHLTPLGAEQFVRPIFESVFERDVRISSRQMGPSNIR